MRPRSRPLSFADLELQAQGVALDATLQALAKFLDGHDELVTLVHADLVRGLKRPYTGRDGLSAAQALRAFVLQRVKAWDLRELRERIADGYTLRMFTTFDSQPVPKHDAFHRAFCRLTPATVRALNDAVVQAAIGLGLEDGAQLRVDTTVVETDIHFPTDCTLLWDAVRVLTRLVKRLGEPVPSALNGCADRTRRARRRMQEISRLTPAQRPRQLKRKYRDLLAVTEGVVATARAAVATARAAATVDPLAAALVTGVCGEIEHVGALADRVIAQARRRVLEGAQVPVHEKIFSIFEPHTDLIKRGKTKTPVEFGHKVFLAESRQGLITDYRVIDGNPVDEVHVAPSLTQHQALFGSAPALYAADRGFYTPDNVEALTAAGVSTECVPQRGGRKTKERTAYEKSRAFKHGQRFRAGIEGRISVLFRGRGMRRCLLEGRDRFEVFVGAAVLANNLLRIADLMSRRAARRRRAA
ncbi:MAG: ISNCY family transposase [Candidatus Rokubacteria bacterium]|nr:ISNCY family transposase [Candidatus Rokubacteria bacterium]